jgi:hypothetical protein
MCVCVCVCKYNALLHLVTHELNMDKVAVRSTAGMSNRESHEGHVAHICVVVRATHNWLKSFNKHYCRIFYLLNLETYHVHTNGLAASHIHECKVMKQSNKSKKNEILNGNMDCMQQQQIHCTKITTIQNKHLFTTIQSFFCVLSWGLTRHLFSMTISLWSFLYLQWFLHLKIVYPISKCKKHS